MLGLIKGRGARCTCQKWDAEYFVPVRVFSGVRECPISWWYTVLEPLGSYSFCWWSWVLFFVSFWLSIVFMCRIPATPDLLRHKFPDMVVGLPHAPLPYTTTLPQLGHTEFIESWCLICVGRDTVLLPPLPLTPPPTHKLQKGSGKLLVLICDDVLD